MARISYAHTLPGRPEAEWHRLETHLRDSADKAEAFASEFGAGEWGRLAGLWHDLGKYSEAFQKYLLTSVKNGDDPHLSELAGRVDHSTAGAQHAAGLGTLGRLLAYCIAGHHAGLPDDHDPQGGLSGLGDRLKKAIEPFGAAPADLLSRPLPHPPSFRWGSNPRRMGFALAFFTRMIYSCLVDADFLDTETFMQPGRAAQRPGERPSCEELLGILNTHLATVGSEAVDTPVNRQRRAILDACRAKATLPPGFFSLNVPTGGGKTLSSLAFALEHAVAHDLSRIIYAIPFTSIIEQTADVFRGAFGDLRTEILEHHSNLEPEDSKRQSERSRLAAENFDATVIVTTNVQLFESLFASRSSRCRKLHRLAKSVIILDEAQTLPPQLLAPTLAALEELVTNYGATVVLCTATQPAIERREDFPIGLENVRPIIDEPVHLHTALRRTSVEFLGVKSNEEIVALLKAERQALCIVNSRRHATDLFKALDDPKALHLSASMCAAHRSEVIDKIRRRLPPKGDKRCRVISTQVIEAGVDVDFPAVFRATAGLDSVAQAAGRCNREGLLLGEDGQPRLGRVRVFNYDQKAYPTSPLIQRAADRFREVMPDHESDLLAPKAIEAFFRLHYWQQGGDFGQGWDKGKEQQSIMELFSSSGKGHLQAQFRTASQAYRLIDDAQTPVLVPYGETGKKLIEELERMPEIPEPHLLRNFDRRAQRYTVGVYDRGLKTLVENDVVWMHPNLSRYYLVNAKAYNEKLGLTFEAVGADSDRFVQ
jgi:CRISPR-associated endonuclease/helicase Cas3